MFRKGLKNLRPQWEADGLLHWRPGTGKDGAWDVFVHYLPFEDGTFYVTEVDIRPHGILGMHAISELPDGGITATVFRSINLGEIVDEIRSQERTRVVNSVSGRVIFHPPARGPAGTDIAMSCTGRSPSCISGRSSVRHTPRMTR